MPKDPPDWDLAVKDQILELSDIVYTGPPEQTDRYSEAAEIFQLHLGQAAATDNPREMAIAHVGMALIHQVQAVHVCLPCACVFVLANKEDSTCRWSLRISIRMHHACSAGARGTRVGPGDVSTQRGDLQRIGQC